MRGGELAPRHTEDRMASTPFSGSCAHEMRGAPEANIRPSSRAGDDLPLRCVEDVVRARDSTFPLCRLFGGALARCIGA